MKLLSRFVLAAAVMAAALSFCGSASAANVTVGPNLTGNEWESYECGVTACTFVNDELAGTGANVKSPVTGAIVGFRVIGGVSSGSFRLRTMEQQGEGSAIFAFKKMTAPISEVFNEGVQAYAASLPVSAGQSVGLTMSETASIGFLEEVGRLTYFGGERPESGVEAGTISVVELAGFNVEIQPAPTAATLSTTSGPTAGGTSVTITGTDLEGASAVDFGGTAAQVTGDSETQVTVVAPASAAAAAVPVTVTTVAGTATAAQQFTYIAPPAPAPTIQCVVPKLSGKTLTAAKKALTKAHCKLGKVKKLGGATPKSGKVAKQGSKAGAKLASGSKVAVTLKPTKPAGKKHKK